MTAARPRTPACEWTVPARDLAGRERPVHVFVSDEHEVVVATPPGEMARLDNVGELIRALETADSVARHQRGPGRSR